MIKRTSVAALALSMSLLVSTAVHEGWIGEARPPVPGDVNTHAFGITTHKDGTPLKAGEKIDPVRGVVRLSEELDKHAQAVKRCAPVPMYQYEFDAYTSLTYNIGGGAFCASSIPKKLAAGDYVAACETIREFVCGPATENTRARPGERCYKKNKPMKVMRGLAIRRDKEYEQCMGKH